MATPRYLDIGMIENLNAADPEGEFDQTLEAYAQHLGVTPQVLRDDYKLALQQKQQQNASFATLKAQAAAKAGMPVNWDDDASDWSPYNIGNVQFNRFDNSAFRVGGKDYTTNVYQKGSRDPRAQEILPGVWAMPLAYAQQWGEEQSANNWGESIASKGPLLAGAAVLGGGLLGGFDAMVGGVGELGTIGSEAAIGAGDTGGFVGGAGGGGELAGGGFAGGAGGGAEVAGAVGGGSLTGLDVPFGTMGGASGVPTVPGGGNALSRFLNGEATAADYASLAGTLGSTVLGVAGSNAQGDAYKDVANQYLNLGAPFRSKLLESYQPGFNVWNTPGLQGALETSWDVGLRGASRNGNPLENPGVLGELNKNITGQLTLPALSNYRGQLGQFGGLGLNTSGAASMAGAGNEGGMYDALGFGLGQLTNPQPTIDDLLKRIGGGLGGYGINMKGGA